MEYGGNVMSEIDFQNGVIVGMATKGLVRSGELYKPTIWNDSGEYSYFYIDFNQSVLPFSIGMFNQSVVIHDSVQLSVNGIEKVSDSVYKIYCDISNRIHGITVMNKKISKLRYADRTQLPAFSVHMFIAGQDQYFELAYIYDLVESPDFFSGFTFDEDSVLYTTTAFAIDPIYDDVAAVNIFSGYAFSETPTLTLI